MVRHRKQKILVGLLAISGLILLSVWNFSSTPESSPSTTPVNSEPVDAVEISARISTFPNFIQSRSKDGELTFTDRVDLAAARLREWEDQDEAEQREQRIEELETLLAQTEPLAVLKKLPADLLDFALGLPMFQQWMTSDPKSAADWMSSRADISEVRVQELAAHWQQTAAEDFQTYFSRLPAGEWKEKLTAHLSQQAVAEDPIKAITLARDLSPGARQTGLLESAVTEWVRQNPEAATQWAGQIGDATLREQLFGSLALGMAETDPQQAADWLVQSVQSGDALNRSAMAVASIWAEQKPAAAADWITRFPEGSTRSTALAELVNHWATSDRAAALDWIGGLPDESLRLQASEFFSTTLLTSSAR